MADTADTDAFWSNLDEVDFLEVTRMRPDLSVTMAANGLDVACPCNWSGQDPNGPSIAKAVEQNVVKQSPSLLALFPNTAFQMQVLAGIACWQQAQGKHFMLIVPTWSDA